MTPGLEQRERVVEGDFASGSPRKMRLARSGTPMRRGGAVAVGWPIVTRFDQGSAASNPAIARVTAQASGTVNAKTETQSSV